MLYECKYNLIKKISAQVFWEGGFIFENQSNCLNYNIQIMSNLKLLFYKINSWEMFRIQKDAKQ